MQKDFENLMEKAGAALGLRNPTAISAQDSTRIVLRFTNDEGKYEQVEIFPETFIQGYGSPITEDSLKAEISRMIQAGESKVMN